ncbi:MAG TPA: VOC family protein [Micromonosporaceae bacterium]|jgi:predicted enzyme related to lactoylglutathione lyase
MRSRSTNSWWGTALEAPDPSALAAFYSRLLDWPVAHEEPGTAILKPPQNNVYMVIQQADDYVPPVWPPTPGAQRTMMHIDVQVDDLDAAVEEAIEIGARLAEFQPQEHVRVMFDPAGHPFCLCRDDD